MTKLSILIKEANEIIIETSAREQVFIRKDPHWWESQDGKLLNRNQIYQIVYFATKFPSKILLFSENMLNVIHSQ